VRGRPRKSGERTPCGALKRHDDGISVAMWQRIKADGIRLGMDPRLGTQLGRLGVIGDLSAAQVTAGFRVAEIYRKFERHHGRRRSIRSPTYNESCRGRSTAGEPGQGQIIAAGRDFLALQDLLSPYPTGARAALEGLCVDDLIAPTWLMFEVRRILSRLARAWMIREPVDTQRRRRRDS
jgi:hypothetical protein